MISYTDLKKGLIILLDNQPYEVLETDFLRMQQRKAVVQSKLKNLLNEKIIEKSWHANSQIEEIELKELKSVFLYFHKDQFWFQEKNNPQNRFCFLKEQLGENTIKFLRPKDDFRPNTEVLIYFIENKLIKISLPIKMEFKVEEAPPSIRGNTSQGGTKTVVIEGGAKISVPFFIETGDIIRINTQTEKYVERIASLREISRKEKKNENHSN